MPAISELTDVLLPLRGEADAAERCGLILLSGKIVEAPNTHSEPNNGFRIDPKLLIKHEGKIAASWHTHPNGTAQLSQDDYQTFLQWPDLFHAIIGSDGVRYYKTHNMVVMEYQP